MTAPTQDQIDLAAAPKCKGCAFAKWDRTASGALHPSGAGQCTWGFVPQELPGSMVYSQAPEVSSVPINRKAPLPRPCKFFQIERRKAGESMREFVKRTGFQL